MQQKIAFGLLAAGLLGLFARGQWQQGELERLSGEVAALKQLGPEIEDAVGVPFVAQHVAGQAPTTAPDLPGVRHQPAEAAAAGSEGRVVEALSDKRTERPVAPAVQATRDQLMEVLESDDPQVRERVQALVDEVNEARRDERREQRQQRWETRTASRLETLAKQVSLSQQQQDALFAIMTAARDRAAEAFRSARESGGDFEAAREEAMKARKTAQAEASELLDERQMQAFDAMLDEERGPGRGPGGGGGSGRRSGP